MEQVIWIKTLTTSKMTDILRLWNIQLDMKIINISSRDSLRILFCFQHSFDSFSQAQVTAFDLRWIRHTKTSTWSWTQLKGLKTEIEPTIYDDVVAVEKRGMRLAAEKLRRKDRHQQILKTGVNGKWSFCGEYYSWCPQLLLSLFWLQLLLCF